MGLFRGAVFRHGGGALKQPIKQPTETPTSTLALMGRFPSLMGRFPTLMVRFTDFVLRGRFTSWKSTRKQPFLRKGALRGSWVKESPGIRNVFIPVWMVTPGFTSAETTQEKHGTLVDNAEYVNKGKLFWSIVRMPVSQQGSFCCELCPSTFRGLDFIIFSNVRGKHTTRAQRPSRRIPCETLTQKYYSRKTLPNYFC